MEKKGRKEESKTEGKHLMSILSCDHTPRSHDDTYLARRNRRSGHALQTLERAGTPHHSQRHCTQSLNLPFSSSPTSLHLVSFLPSVPEASSDISYPVQRGRCRGLVPLVLSRLWSDRPISRRKLRLCKIFLGLSQEQARCQTPLRPILWGCLFWLGCRRRRTWIGMKSTKWNRKEHETGTLRLVAQKLACFSKFLCPVVYLHPGIPGCAPT